MRLAFKILVTLSAAVVLLVCGVLWRAHRSELSRAAEAEDARLRAAVSRVAAYCAAASGEPGRECLEGLRFLGLLTVPEAFQYALLADANGMVLAHTDFLRGDFSLKSERLPQAVIAAAAKAAGPGLQFLTQGAERFGVYSAPVLVDRGRAGTVLAAYRASGLGGGKAEAAAEARLGFAQSSALGAAVAILAAVGLTWLLLGELQPIARASERVARGDFKTQVAEDRDDELGDFAKEFNRMVRRLDELDELKETFLAQITHDLRNPLNAMLLHAQLAAGKAGATQTPDQAAKSLAVILDSGKTLAELIDAILDVARLEAGKLDLKPAALELRDLVRSSADLFRAQADAAKVRLACDFKDGVETAFADPSAVKRILSNLVSNALKFTPAGGSVTIAVRRASPKEVELSVSDSGPGIPPDRLGALFKKFSRVPEYKDKPGTGLGLYTTKLLVEGMGGRIAVENAGGAKFRVTLPEEG